MPNYEYRCLDCRRRFTVYIAYKDYGKVPVVCSHCQSAHILRRLEKVRIARSDESRLENLADPGNLDTIDEDPRALGRMMRQMSSETGETMGPEFDEVVKRLEKGQSPDDIEKALPELGDAGGPGEDSFGGGGFDDAD